VDPYDDGVGRRDVEALRPDARDAWWYGMEEQMNDGLGLYWFILLIMGIWVGLDGLIQVDG
jgi:hypothetical protein